MSETKHTSGPWKITQGGDECCIYIEEIGYHANGRGAIATVFTVREKPDETENADARLIAAAPELLASLKRCAALCRPHSASFEAEAVIAKAEGRP